MLCRALIATGNPARATEILQSFWRKETLSPDLESQILAQSEFPLLISPDLKGMDHELFRDAPIGLQLPQKPRRVLEVSHG